MSRAHKRNGSKRGELKNGEKFPVNRRILLAHKGAAQGYQQNILNDLRVRPPGVGITQSPPMNYRDNILWIEDNVDITTNYTSGGTVFVGTQFALTDMFTLPLFAALYDQYCIYSVTARFMFEFSNTGATPGEFLSAIDFDSATTPTGPGALENYSTFEVMSITQGCCQTRFVQPCVTPLVFQGATIITSYSVARQWIDSADTAIPHFGLKYGIRGNQQAVIGKCYLSYVVGYRNKL
jgi:hypothetical protein